MNSGRVRRLIRFFFLVGAVGNLCGQTVDLTTIAEKTRPSVFLITTADRAGNALAAGTGFLVSKEGYLVTNHHVIRKAASAVAKADNGATFRVEGILATDVQRDLAVLKIASRDTPSLALAASVSVKAGEKVAVIGSPLGLEGSLSEGIVAANREIKEFGRMVQITAPHVIRERNFQGLPSRDLCTEIFVSAVGFHPQPRLYRNTPGMANSAPAGRSATRLPCNRNESCRRAPAIIILLRWSERTDARRISRRTRPSLVNRK